MDCSGQERLNGLEIELHVLLVLFLGVKQLKLSGLLGVGNIRLHDNITLGRLNLSICLLDKPSILFASPVIFHFNHLDSPCLHLIFDKWVLFAFCVEPSEG